MIPHLGQRPRIAIVGGPAAGKSTLAAALEKALGTPVRATDRLAGLDWSHQSGGAADWLRSPGPQIVEGVAVVRGLRRMLRAGERPDFVVVRVATSRRALSPAQRALERGVETIWSEVEPELRRLGVKIITID